MQATRLQSLRLQEALADAAEEATARAAILRAEMQAVMRASAAAGEATADFSTSRSTVGESNALVPKWALDQFSGEQEDWSVFALSFMSHVGAMLRSAVGTAMDQTIIFNES